MPFAPELPPRCLQNFRVRSVAPSEAGLPDGVSFNSYLIECTCSHDIWRIHGYLIAGTLAFDDPLFLECRQCNRIIKLIDTEHDGYDAEVGQLGIPSLEKMRIIWKCETCQSEYGRVIASFGYQYDLGDGAVTGTQNLFDTFRISHICLDTNEIIEVATFECA